MIIASMPLSDREIEDALRSAARIVDRYGDVYWPLFERLERELAERRSRKARLSAHLGRQLPASRALQTFPQETGGRSSRVHRV